ncbi:TSC22 domain family protein 1 isoform X1 [Osmerus mordax]|uniref:TSC22 domain family protein 1 isoform X1 n=1 Tax=Osmerus mordax TaxID=8014 RepID=UPI00350FFF8F
MHHPDSADSGSVRKMAHPAIFPRRGSNTGSGSGSTSTPACSGVNNSHVPAEDYQSSLLTQSQPPAGSSSPGTQHPPHSLNLHSQPLPAQSVGAQMKKKSGFQITSVTPAQISVSTNNSIAEDTESYDDLDESHTEDLSSSEILDVSLSRANEIAGAERSSSEETLNNFHEAETPGAVSPNQSLHPHSLTQAPQHGGTMVNGTVHHHNHHQHPHQAQAHNPSSGTGLTASALTSGAFTSIAQKMPSNMGATLESVSVGLPSVAAQPVVAVAPGPVPGMHSSATGATVSIVNPLTSNVSNVNVLSSANVPVMGGVSTSASSSGGFPSSIMTNSGGGVVMGNSISNPNITMIQHQSGVVNSSINMTPGAAAACAPTVMGLSNVSNAGVAGRTPPGVIPGSTMSPAQAQVPSSQPSPASVPAPAAASSRFRVVKLDSSSEPFKKGRWTCAEYYDKDLPASASASLDSVGPSARAAEAVRQFAPESMSTVGTERESTSGSSVSSTLSHYAESVGSGETGGPLPPHLPAQLQDYTSSPQGVQAPLAGFPMAVSHTQPHLHLQDMTHAHLKTTMAPSNPTSVHQPIPISMAGLQTTIGHPNPPMSQQQLTYAQAAAIHIPGSTQGLAGVHQQQMGYASPHQHPPAPQAGPALIRPLSQGGSLPPDYPQTLPQSATSHALPHLTGSASSGPGNGPAQIMGAQQQQPPVVSMAQPQVQASPQNVLQQASSLQASTGGMVPQMGLVGTGLGQPPQSHSIPLEQQQQTQSLPVHTQGISTQLPNPVPLSQVTSHVPPPNPQSDPQSQSQVQNGSGGMVQSQPARVSMAQDFSSANAHAQAVAAQANALYASLPSFTSTQLEDAQRLLLQHQSALMGFPKLAGEGGAGAGAGQGTEGSTGVSALTASTGLFKAVDGDDDGSSGASVVAIDNKIEQAMDLVKSHLMYAVREEVEVLKEQIKELIERNSQLEQENTLLKKLASPEQMAQFQAQVQTGSPPAPTQAPVPQPSGPALPASHNSGPSA